MTNNPAPPKVRFTTLSATENGHLLTLFTIAGPTVEFLLDDLALATLSLMAAPLIDAAAARGKDDLDNLKMFGKDEVDE